MRPTRRQFVVGAGALLAGCATSQPPRPKNKVPVVDAHVHCFAGYDEPRYPYHADAPYKPEAASRPDQLVLAMDGASA